MSLVSGETFSPGVEGQSLDEAEAHRSGSSGPAISRQLEHGDAQGRRREPSRANASSGWCTRSLATVAVTHVRVSVGGRGTISCMQRAFGMDVPESVTEMCQPPRAAVLVYDAQVGIVTAVRDRALVLTQIRSVVDAARKAGVPVLYVRHVSVPPSHMGVGALRTAMAWQRVERAEDVRSTFPEDASHTQLVDELQPEAGEPVFHKLGMSAFVGTPLEVVLRDRGVITLILVGAVLEIGIEATARHAADLGFLPVVVEDACGVVEGEAAQRSLASLDYSFMSYRATTAQVVEALSGA
jgi:biuret amidohydrolase